MHGGKDECHFGRRSGGTGTGAAYIDLLHGICSASFLVFFFVVGQLIGITLVFDWFSFFLHRNVERKAV